MKYLFDTSTLKNEINDIEEIQELCKYCKSKNTPFCISDEILVELKPNPVKMLPTEYKKANNFYRDIGMLVLGKKIQKIDVNSDCRYQENFKKIRKRFYGWMTDIPYCQKLGLTMEEIRSNSFKYKDYGECTLIAIALTNKNDYIIISEDRGRVHKHPDINIFEVYINKGVNITKFYFSDLFHEYKSDVLIGTYS